VHGGPSGRKTNGADLHVMAAVAISVDGGGLAITSGAASPSRSPNGLRSPVSWRRALSFSTSYDVHCSSTVSPSSAVTLNTEELLRKYDCDGEEASSSNAADHFFRLTRATNDAKVFVRGATDVPPSKEWENTGEGDFAGLEPSHEDVSFRIMAAESVEEEVGASTSFGHEGEVTTCRSKEVQGHFSSQRPRALNLVGSMLTRAIGILRRATPSPEGGGALLAGAALAVVALRKLKVDRQSEIHFTLNRTIGEKLLGVAKVTVKQDETMWGLWQKHQGRLKDLDDLMNCNQHVQDPDLLPVSVELRLPRRGLAKRLLGDGCIRDAERHSLHEERRRELSRIARAWSQGGGA